MAEFQAFKYRIWGNPQNTTCVLAMIPLYKSEVLLVLDTTCSVAL